MPDAMDRCQAFNDDHVADALQRHRERTPSRPGLRHCERADCKEPIHPARTAAHARLCEECQVEQDKRNAHFAAWPRR